MAQVFLSYARSNAGKARPIAEAIEKAGHNVWWDRHIEGGAQYANAIEEALASAQVVVVLWSAESVKSHWVRDEAAAGRDTGRLVPVTLDGAEPPLGFRQFQTMDLSQWKGRGKADAVDVLLASIQSAASGKRADVFPQNPRRSASGSLAGLLARPWRLIALIIGVAIFTLGLLISRPWERANDEPPPPAAVPVPPSR